MTPTIAVLAGGLATRLRPITASIPKALVPVLGVPFACRLLHLLRRNGFRKVVFLVGYRGQEIADALGDGGQFDLNIEYAFDGPVLLGTGGAIAKALPQLGDEFAVIYGDSWLDFDYQQAVRQFSADQRSGLMTVYRNDGQWDESNVDFDGKNILAYSKSRRTSRMRYIDYGFSLFRSHVFEGIPIDQPTDLSHITEKLADNRQLAGFEVYSRFYEVGSMQGLADLETHLSGEAK